MSWRQPAVKSKPKVKGKRVKVKGVVRRFAPVFFKEWLASVSSFLTFDL
jgi:hypothetical protein